ncbi:hypothetical protein H105_08322 [Trichophyton soudanense CBS 452.61]|nr:hypothetical protein H105_08322 [Trichophyton soudanense CBS 452.61]
MQYDRESGQVYTQEVIRVAPSSRRWKGFAWVHDSPLLPAGWEAYSPVGAHSLKHMAMRAVLSDQRTLSTAHFKGVPWSIARYLWECVCRSKRTSLYLWKIFATAYPAEFNQISHRYLLKPSSKKMAVTNYLKLLSSASVDWTAVVSLSVELFEPHEFLEVANVRNLIGLEIRTQPKRTEFGYEATVSVSDRVIKGWSEQALTGQAFEHLQILVLRLQTGLTEHMFAYLNAFPTLNAFLMQGCPRLYSKEAREMAEKHGWVPFVVHYSDHSLYKIIENMDSELESQTQDCRLMCIDSLPVVDFSLYCRNLRSLHSEEQILFRRKYRATDHLSLQEKKAQKTHNGSDIAPSQPDSKQNKRVVKESCKKDMKGLLDQFNGKNTQPAAGEAGQEAVISPRLSSDSRSSSSRSSSLRREPAKLSHRQSLGDSLRGVPSSPRARRQPSFTQAAVQSLIDNPPSHAAADPAFSGRDWTQISIGELVQPVDLKFVDADTSIEDATNLLIESSAHSLLIRESPGSSTAVGTFGYADLNAYLLLVVGLIQPSHEEQVASLRELARRAREGEKIPLKDVKGLGMQEPLTTMPQSTNLMTAVETFGGGVHRIIVVKEGTTEVIGVFTQWKLVKFLWENGRSFPVIEQLYPQHLRELRLGSHCVISINGDRPLCHALELMNNEGVSSLAVVDNQWNVVGNISVVDVKLLTKSTSLPLLHNTCIHFISVILSTRGITEGQDSFPVFHINPQSTLAHTVAKLVATRSHR